MSQGHAQFALAISAISLCLFAGCPKQSSQDQAVPKPSAESKKLIIAVSYPLEFLTQRIAGSDFDVRCPVPAGQAASTWRPNRDDIQRMQKAEMVVANGVGARFAKWLEMASIPTKKICNSATRGLSIKDFIEIDDVRYTHSHGNLGEHSHPTNCAYTWLNPEIAQKQSKHIHDDLIRRFPEQASEFSKRYAALTADLKELQAAFAAIPQSAEAEFATVLTAQPELKFFSRACNWDDLHLKWFEVPEEATANLELEQILTFASNRPTIKRKGKTLLLSTYPFPESLLKSLAPHNVSVVVIDKLDLRPEKGDYLSVMHENVEKLKE
jgi:zinc transport system substrate-binding protein